MARGSQTCSLSAPTLGSEATGTSDSKASQLDSIPGAQGRSPGSMPGYSPLETSMDTEKRSIPWNTKFCPSETQVLAEMEDCYGLKIGSKLNLTIRVQVLANRYQTNNI